MTPDVLVSSVLRTETARDVSVRVTDSSPSPVMFPAVLES